MRLHVRASRILSPRTERALKSAQRTLGARQSVSKNAEIEYSVPQGLSPLISIPQRVARAGARHCSAPLHRATSAPNPGTES